jgi:hypothetical protein
MTPTELRLWSIVMRRAGAATPELAAQLLAAFQVLRDRLSDREITAAIAAGYIDQIITVIVSDAVFQSAMQPVRDTMRRNLVQSVRYYARALPVPPPTARSLVISFDYLSPNVITAIRQLETATLGALEQSTRETVRAFVENGLRDGSSARSIITNIKSSFGLAPSQAAEVANFRDALAGLNGRSITNYNLRSETVDRLLAKGPLSADQIERYTEQYRQRRIAQNAYTNARTASVDAQRLANRLAWQHAIDKGFVDGDRLMKQRIGVDDDRERPEHVAINNEVRPFDEPYSNGEMVSGDRSFNCRCVDRMYLARA